MVASKFSGRSGDRRRREWYDGRMGKQGNQGLMIRGIPRVEKAMNVESELHGDRLRRKKKRWRESGDSQLAHSVPPDFLPLPKPRFFGFTGLIGLRPRGSFIYIE